MIVRPKRRASELNRPMCVGMNENKLYWACLLLQVVIIKRHVSARPKNSCVPFQSGSRSERCSRFHCTDALLILHAIFSSYAHWTKARFLLARLEYSYISRFCSFLWAPRSAEVTGKYVAAVKHQISVGRLVKLL